MDFGDVLTVLAVVVGVVFVLGVAVIVFVMVKYRVPPRGVIAMAAALAYLVSPVDVLPEVVLGPLGLIDDGSVIVVVGIWIYKLVQARQILRDAGVGRRGDQPPAARGRKRR